MRLWTQHSPDFSLTSGSVNHKKSLFAQQYPDAYAKLSQILDKKKVVWCVPSIDDIDQVQTKVIWELEVDPNAILRTIDWAVWNGILGNRLGASKRLRNEAFDRFPASPQERQRWIDGELSSRESMGWDKLFITDPTCIWANPLLEHPIPETWVVCRTQTL